MSWTNYHSHCNFCDGSDEAKVYPEAAAEQGMLAYGFSSHVPMPFFCAWSMKAEKLADYIAEIENFLGIPVGILAFGPERKEILFRKDYF